MTVFCEYENGYLGSIRDEEYLDQAKEPDPWSEHVSFEYDIISEQPAFFVQGLM
jgi:hypothetical protein